MIKYYSLLTLEHGNGVSRWCPQFGDYERQIVVTERDSYVESQGYKKKDTKIVCTGDRQADIEQYCKQLNATR